MSALGEAVTPAAPAVQTVAVVQVAAEEPIQNYGERKYFGPMSLVSLLLCPICTGCGFLFGLCPVDTRQVTGRVFDADPGFIAHTVSLYKKNWLLKKRQWAGGCCISGCNIFCCAKKTQGGTAPAAAAGSCCPCAFICEVILPILLILPLVIGKMECGDLCIGLTVGGWGGRIPQSSVVAGVHDCVDGVNGARCDTWLDHHDQANSFFDVLQCMHVSGHRFALVADDAADAPKLDRIAEWISTNWYPEFTAAQGYNSGGSDGRPAGVSSQLQSCVFDPWEGRQNCNQGSNTTRLPSFAQLRHPSLTTSDQLQSYVKSKSYGIAGGEGYLWGAFVFHSIPGDGSNGTAGDWDYSIRLNSTAVPGTDQPATHTLDSTQRGFDGDGTQYLRGGFVAAQLLVDRYIISDRDGRLDTDKVLQKAGMRGSSTASPGSIMSGSISGGDGWCTRGSPCEQQLAEPLRYAPHNVDAAPMPFPGTSYNRFYMGDFGVKNLLGLFFILSFMYSTFSLLTWLITEKETKIRETLKMMGVQTGSLLVSFYALHGAVFGVLMAFFTIYLCGLPYVWHDAVFPTSSMSIIFLFMWLWAMAFVAFAFAFHTLFHKTMTGGVVGAVMMLAQFILYSIVSEGYDEFGIGLLCIFPNCALTVGVDILADLEVSASPVHALI